jgi:formate hydrogenlyase subunit 6/NADH:ubiquinone oxidoreductase subunit I
MSRFLFRTMARYQLHNEIEDCIVCDKCAKICPVDCIEIEPIKSVGEFGKTSDGTSKRIYAAKFDIDLAKCCFCGLCTTVCPTESLTMTPEYDFSTFDLTTLNFGFGNISESEAEEKRREWNDFQAKKQAEKPVTSEQTTESKRLLLVSDRGWLPGLPFRHQLKQRNKASLLHQNNRNHNWKMRALPQLLRLVPSEAGQ